jgi:putative transposase
MHNLSCGKSGFLLFFRFPERKLSYQPSKADAFMPSMVVTQLSTMEGFSMPSLTFQPVRGKSDTRLITRAFMADEQLPFADVLPAETIRLIFQKHDCWFGETYNALYTTTIVLWSFLSQTLSDGKSRSCSAAVSRIIFHCMALKQTPPSTDTGDYCSARAKLDENAIRELMQIVDRNTKKTLPEKWLWKGRHAKLIDGFTATMPDEKANQNKFPQNKNQKPGIGFPILRACVILSLATACITDAALGPYSGKETGETALLREMFDTFDEGDIAVFDRYYSSYMMIAQLQQRGVDVCVRMHHMRKSGCRIKRLGKCDHLCTWDRPQCPKWMNRETYETIPKTLTLRVVTYSISTPGCRTRKITVVTTLLDEKTYTAEDIAQLYGYRWNSELDIRHIKQTLNLDHMRCKKPAMIRREFYTTLLAYNLIRKVICQASHLSGVLPRRISFTRTCAHLLEAWQLLTLGVYSLDQLNQILKDISQMTIPDRPNRIEPRVLKRRRHGYKLMQQPRAVLRAKIKSGTISREKREKTV